MTKLSEALWCDLKTDEEKCSWLLLGRGYETGVIAKSIQSDLVIAYRKIIEYKNLNLISQALSNENLLKVAKEIVSNAEEYDFHDGLGVGISIDLYNRLASCVGQTKGEE